MHVHKRAFAHEAFEVKQNEKKKQRKASAQQPFKILNFKCCILNEYPASFFHLRFQFTCIPPAITDEDPGILFGDAFVVDACYCLFEIAAGMPAAGNRLASVDQFRPAVNEEQVLAVDGPAVVQGEGRTVTELYQLVEVPVEGFVDDESCGAVGVVFGDENDGTGEEGIVKRFGGFEEDAGLK